MVPVGGMTSTAAMQVAMSTKIKARRFMTGRFPEMKTWRYLDLPFDDDEPGCA
jgi:hypothetical protein